MNDPVNECLRSIFDATRTGNGFNKTMKTGNGFNKITKTGNGFNKVIMYILPSKQKREILFEATRTDAFGLQNVCEICNTTVTQVV